MVKVERKEERRAPSKFPQNLVTVGELQIITSSGELFNHVDEGLPMWVGEGDRVVSHEIEFDQPFSEAPSITLGMSGLDAAHDQNLRYALNALLVKETGFLVEFKTWSDTHIARASVSWQAVGKVKPKGAISLERKKS